MLTKEYWWIVTENGESTAISVRLRHALKGIVFIKKM